MYVVVNNGFGLVNINRYTPQLCCGWDNLMVNTTSVAWDIRYLTALLWGASLRALKHKREREKDK
jgi:hypothetical protein